MTDSKKKEKASRNKERRRINKSHSHLTLLSRKKTEKLERIWDQTSLVRKTGLGNWKLKYILKLCMNHWI